MHKDKVKEIVGQANQLKATNDKNLESDEARNLTSTLLINLAKSSQKNPYFAVAIYQHLDEEGFQIQHFRGEAYGQFVEVFGKKIEEVDENQKVQIRRIAENMFSPERL